MSSLSNGGKPTKGALRGRKRLAGAVALLALLALAGEARADAWADCASDTAETTVSGCTAIIAAGKRPAADLATAYHNRGVAYADMGESDLAIDDFGKAIKLKPAYVEAYYNRGLAYAGSGQTDLAIADFDKTIQLKPSHAEAYYNRALAYSDNGDSERAIADYGKAILAKPDYAEAYYARGALHEDADELDLAIADYTRAIQFKPDYAEAYSARGGEYYNNGEYDLAIADATRAIQLKPDFSDAYVNRGNAYDSKGKFDLAIADYGKAIALAPEDPEVFYNRALAYAGKDLFDLAIADYKTAIGLNADYQAAYYNRAVAYAAKDLHALAIADYGKSIELNGEDPDAFYSRGLSYAAAGDPAKALADFEKAAELFPEDNAFHSDAQTRIAEMKARLSPPASPPVVVAKVDPASPPVAKIAPPPVPGPPLVVPPGSRVALVIGNGAYASVPVLANPISDAGLIAAALKADGFQVTLVSDAGREDLVKALRSFAPLADAADWAVVYYAGHGIEMGGQNYLVPVDARLLQDRDVPDEAIALDRVLATVEGARSLSMVVLDACRNNPFLTTMKRSGGSGRDIGRGLAIIEPSQATLVAYSAKAGSVAADGEGGNSPFARAFAQRLTQPGVEIGKLFRLVRDDVLAATGKKQEPFVYGSLPGTDFFFSPPAVVGQP